jgi:hypothetical protein
MLARGLLANRYNTMKICLAPFRILWTPYLGGQSWVYLNWVLGLQANGCEVTILETVIGDDRYYEWLQKQMESVELRKKAVEQISAYHRINGVPISEIPF